MVESWLGAASYCRWADDWRNPSAQLCFVRLRLVHLMWLVIEAAFYRYRYEYRYRYARQGKCDVETGCRACLPRSAGGSLLGLLLEAGANDRWRLHSGANSNLLDTTLLCQISCIRSTYESILYRTARHTISDVAYVVAWVVVGMSHLQSYPHMAGLAHCKQRAVRSGKLPYLCNNSGCNSSHAILHPNMQLVL